MYGMDGIDGLNFHDQRILNNEVQSITGIDPHVAVDNRQRHLRRDGDPALLKLLRQARFIS